MPIYLHDRQCNMNNVAYAEREKAHYKPFRLGLTMIKCNADKNERNIF